VVMLVKGYGDLNSIDQTIRILSKINKDINFNIQIILIKLIILGFICCRIELDTSYFRNFRKETRVIFFPT